MWWHWTWADPGPCPVDDTPHTACTPATVGTIRTTAYRPRVLDLYLRDRAVQPPPESVITTFSTKEYRRRVHGAAIKAAVKRARKTRE